MWPLRLLLIALFISIPFVVPRITKGFADGNWKRFSLRKLLVVMSLIAFLLWAVPAAIEARQWWITEQYVETVFEEVSRSDDLTFRGGSYQDKHYTIANYPYQQQRRTDVPGFEGQTVVVADGEPMTAESEERRKQGHVYVHPPGKWAKTPAEITQLLKDNL